MREPEAEMIRAARVPSLPPHAREPNRARHARGMPTQAVLGERARPGSAGATHVLRNGDEADANERKEAEPRPGQRNRGGGAARQIRVVDAARSTYTRAHTPPRAHARRLNRNHKRDKER
jgi:hypothetical protein